MSSRTVPASAGVHTVAANVVRRAPGSAGVHAVAASVVRRAPGSAGVHAVAASVVRRAPGSAGVHAVAASVVRGTPGSAGVPPAPAGGRKWTTRRRPTVVRTGGTPGFPGTPFAAASMPRWCGAKSCSHGFDSPPGVGCGEMVSHSETNDHRESTTPRAFGDRGRFRAAGNRRVPNDCGCANTAIHRIISGMPDPGFQESTTPTGDRTP